jgi:glycosyltransferase involved in cell wall biosynthesis
MRPSAVAPPPIVRPRPHPEPAAGPTDDLGLQGKHFLLDGYNLERRHGTGVKSYALSVIRALRGEGARVGILSSCRRSAVPSVQDALLNEASGRRGSRIPTAVVASRALLGLSLPARRHEPDPRVLCNAQGESMAGLAERYYIAPHCFHAANRLFAGTGVSLRVRTPDRVDVWHATYPLPVAVKGARKVTTVHDLIPLKLPWVTRDDKRFYHRLVRHALARSDLVLTVSESAKGDLVDTFGVAPERVEVVYQAVAHAPEELPEDVVARRLGMYGLRLEGYLLFVGAVQPRKNLGRLCQALRSLDCDVPLVAVGGKGWLWKEELRQAEPLLAAGKLLLLDHVPWRHLQALYAGALFLAFPSLYEGCGLPPLEAMGLGCPVLASHTSSLPEVCGDAALFVNPFDVDDLADKIRTLLDDEGLRWQLRALGRERANLFTAERFAGRLRAAYAKLLR